MEIGGMMTRKEPEGEQKVGTTNDSGIEIFLDDAGGRDLRDPEERPPDDEVEEIEAERRQRLDAAHRPRNAEVDNTHREFDPAVGMFTDSEGYDSAARRYAARAEGQA
jgi:hypothetical protein